MGISKTECSCKTNKKQASWNIILGALSYLRTIIHYSGPISKNSLREKNVHLVISKHSKTHAVEGERKVLKIQNSLSSVSYTHLTLPTN